MTRFCLVGGLSTTHQSAAIEIGPGRPLTIIAGPCTLESRELGVEVGHAMREACEAAGLRYLFKASFDKANRTSLASHRGPGLVRGLEDLAAVREHVGAPITTDVHEPDQASDVAEVVDLLQIPAFLCRQTDLLIACGEAAVQHHRAVNIKKGQFVSPAEMIGPVRKVASTGCSDILLTERGTFFGYHRLVNDFVGLGDLIEQDAGGGPCPVCFDCTHSTQQPGVGATSGGRPERAAQLARAAVACGVHAIFLECHPEPACAVSDAATMLPLEQAVALVGELAVLHAALASAPARS